MKSLKLLEHKKDLWSTIEQLGLKRIVGPELQIQLASKLRALAIEWLRHSETPVAVSFRNGTYLPHSTVWMQRTANHDAQEKFLNQQARSKQWASYIEATALAECLNCTLLIQTGTAPAWALYRSADPKRPILSLVNAHNTHFEADPKFLYYVKNPTLGDGNCLYNALAQTLCDHQINQMNTAHQPKSITFFSSKPHTTEHHRQVTEAQSQRFLEYSRCDVSHNASNAQYETYLNALPVEKKELIMAQIDTDYRLAVAIAQDMMDHSDTQEPSIHTSLCDTPQ